MQWNSVNPSDSLGTKLAQLQLDPGWPGWSWSQPMVLVSLQKEGFELSESVSILD